ncbi:hypothetical protein BSPLISOX_1986 [uncultured Gammaproteobacteria bacterium]|nr:hypothetical protein [uncultured Gammaproteobacteria bacterium]CAC9439130.1 hypothetical protein [uncultured Gammaproteobacteria bacterium]VVH64177.1 hypothetical protein BSPLISOX_1986 [uncultured Gammaproteobacteria bacterium]
MIKKKVANKITTLKVFSIICGLNLNEPIQEPKKPPAYFFINDRNSLIILLGIIPLLELE